MLQYLLRDHLLERDDARVAVVGTTRAQQLIDRGADESEDDDDHENNQSARTTPGEKTDSKGEGAISG